MYATGDKFLHKSGNYFTIDYIKDNRMYGKYNDGFEASYFIEEDWHNYGYKYIPNKEKRVKAILDKIDAIK